ncbi:MAG: hypothetical protein IJG13_11360, partial [Kiritimatiellae bacterium]|nr:hypothetical protein [Kiritimatiellia bacterium]
IAMVAEAGPLFLIPGLTRSAYRATGQLGTTLNGLRGRLAGGAGTPPPGAGSQGGSPSGGGNAATGGDDVVDADFTMK